MSFYQKHKRGIIGTAIYHAIVLMMLLLLGFFTPLPLPEEEGILVQFGTSDQGFGRQEPAPRQMQPEPSPPVQQEQAVQPSTPPPQPASTPPPEPAQPAEVEAMTQDYEETAAIDAAEKKRQEEAERKRLLEEQQRRQQLEEQRRAETERQRQAEAERKKREEEQRRITEINSRAQGAFGNSSQDGQGTSTSQSQGATFPGGNQGVPTGGDGGTFGPGGSGSGNQGTGISYSLDGRTARSMPKPVYPGNDEGLVVVKVTVDKNGNVTAAEPGARGTTIMERQFWNEARKAALKAKFNVDDNAPAFQQGTISYRFRLN